jgi:PAS domain S-box-containing protein
VKLPPELAAAVLAALDEAPLGVSVNLTRDGAVTRVFANKALAELLGMSVDELRASPPLMSAAPEERERMASIAREWGDDKAAVVETKFLRRDGQRVPVEVRVGGALAGEGNVTISLVSDISARIAVQDALRESETRFRTLAEAAPDTITVISRGRMVYANPAAVRVLGFA